MGEVERKAREILAAEYEKHGFYGAADDARAETPSPHCRVTIDAIASALASRPDAWPIIEEMCVITEAVTPDKEDARGTINRLIDYHVELDRASRPAGEAVADALAVVNDAANEARHRGDYQRANGLVKARVTLFKAATAPTAVSEDVRELVRLAGEYANRSTPDAGRYDLRAQLYEQIAKFPRAV